MSKPRDMLYEVLEVAVRDAHLTTARDCADFKAMVADWANDCVQEWAANRRGIPKHLRPGSVHLRITYHEDD